MLSNKRFIASKKLNIAQLQEHFKDKNIFETDDIAEFYRRSEPGLKSTTINWRVYELVQKGVLERISSGKFRLGTGKNWQPEISHKTISLYERIKKDFPYLKICIWNTSVLNEFMIHQPGRFYQIVEVEKEATEAIFFWLKEAKFTVAMDPSQDFIEKYVTADKETTIVKSLVSEAPLQTIQGIYSPAIEKILVDIFCDEIIFNAQQGSEMRTIFSEAFEKYSIFKDRLFRYASRRGKKELLENYVNTFSNFRQ